MKFGLTCQFGWKIYYGKFFFWGIELGEKWINVGCGDVDVEVSGKRKTQKLRILSLLT